MFNNSHFSIIKVIILFIFCTLTSFSNVMEKSETKKIQYLNEIANADGEHSGLIRWNYYSGNEPGSNNNRINLNQYNSGNRWVQSAPNVVGSAPIIVCLGEDAILSVIAEDGNKYLYQWQKDGINIEGANEPLLFIKNCQFENSATYQCVMKSISDGSIVFSDEMLLYVVGNVKISKQPQSNFVALGGRAEFSFEAHLDSKVPDNDPYIQWYKGNTALKDNERICGANSSVLSIRNIQESDFGNDYYVVVKGNCGEAVSDTVSIIQANINITANTTNFVSCGGQPATFGVQVQYAGDISEITYQWYFNNTPLSDNGKYSGTQTNMLKIEDIVNEDVGKYYVIISLKRFEIDVKSDVAELMIRDAVEIVKQPITAWFMEGTQLDLVITVIGSEPMTFAWYKDGVPLNYISSNTFTIPNVSAADAGIYLCYISNPCGTIVTQECWVTISNFVINDVKENEDIRNFEIAPNPTNDLAAIKYKIAEPSDCNIYITDIYGRMVAELLNKYIDANDYSISFSAKDYNLPSGTYLLTIRTGKTLLTKRMMIIR